MNFKDFTDAVGPQFFVLMQWVLFGVLLTVGWFLKRGLTESLDALRRIPSTENLDALKRIPNQQWFDDIKATLDTVTRLTDHKVLVTLVGENTTMLRDHERLLRDHDMMLEGVQKQVDGIQKNVEKDHERLSKNIAETDYHKTVLELRQEPRPHRKKDSE